MTEPQCPSCGSGDCTVVGLEDSQIRFRCMHCAETWLDTRPDTYDPLEVADATRC